MSSWLPQRLSNRLLLSSAVQLLLVGVALGLLGYATGQREGLQRLAVERQQHQLTVLSEALSARLRAPQTINHENMLAIRQGVLPLNNFERMGQHFWRQMQLYPVGYINWGSREGRFLGVERLDSGQLVLNEDSDQPLGRGKLGVYALGAHGERGRLLEVVPGMETFHQEAWYAETVRAGKATWSSIYQWEDKPQVLAISFNEPVRDNRGTVLGVIGVDFVLSQLSSWLQQLWRQQPGLALIVEPNGLLVASSRPDLSLVQGRKRLRARLDQLDNPLAQVAASSFFVPHSVDGRGRSTSLRPHQAVIAAGQRARLPAAKLNGQTYTLEAWPWGRAEGLNWLLITAISQDASLLQSQHQSLAAGVLGLVALAGAVALNRQLIGWLLAPMELLQRRAAEATRSTPQPFDPQLPEGAATELANMAAAFGALVAKLERSQQELAAAAQRELLQDAKTMELLKDKLRSSLEASAVAHEIKLPLSEILLSSRMLLQASGDGSAISPQTREQLQGIANAADAVVTTIEKMRTLLRNVQTSHQPLNLAHLTRSALMVLKPTLAAAGVEVVRTGLEAPCPIQGDSTQLQIAIVNVLRNSVEALQQVRGPRQIQVSLSCQGPDAVLQIDDNGPGLPAELEPLEPLESGRAQGSGLGLYVVQTTINNHKGQITLGRSPALGGASIVLRLPRVDLPTSG